MIGKYLPRKTGTKFSIALGSFVNSFNSWDINRYVRNNQNIIHDGSLSPQELKEISKQVLTHAGRCYFDLYHYYNKPAKIEDLIPWTDTFAKLIDYSRSKQGYMVVAPHLSNFDLVVARLVSGGFIGRVLSYPNPGSGYQLQNQIRESFGMDLRPLGDSKMESEIVQYLKDGGMVATGVDRPVPSRKKRHYVHFFGKPSPLPLGYITTALAADVPILAVAAYMLPDGRYGLRMSDPIILEKQKNKLDSIILNAELVLKQLEKFIRLSPEQWLMYYPVWPDLLDDDI